MAKAKKVLLPNPVDVAAIKQVIFPIWKKAVPDRRKYEDAFYGKYKKKGEAELARLQKIFTTKGLEAFIKALYDSGYRWNAEQFDTIASPWVICASQFLDGRIINSDCDDSMVLCYHVLGGRRMWLGCEMKNGQPQNFQKWHWILEFDAHIISNFDLYDNETPEEFFLDYNSKFNYIVEAMKDFSAVGEIRRIR